WIDIDNGVLVEKEPKVEHVGIACFGQKHRYALIALQCLAQHHIELRHFIWQRMKGHARGIVHPLSEFRLSNDIIHPCVQGLHGTHTRLKIIHLHFFHPLAQRESRHFTYDGCTNVHKYFSSDGLEGKSFALLLSATVSERRSLHIVEVHG